MSSTGDLGAVGPAGEPEPPRFVDELDVAQTLARVEQVTLTRQALEVEQLVLAQHFARLHSDDPAEGVPRRVDPHPGTTRQLIIRRATARWRAAIRAAYSSGETGA